MAAAINLNLSNLLTNTYATPIVLNATGEDNAYVYTKQAYCAIPVVGTDLAGSTYNMVRVFSSDIPLEVSFASTALTAGALSVGILNADTKTEAVTNSGHLFATSIDCSSAVAMADKRFTNLALTTIGQRVWQLLGLTSDPLQYYDLAFTSTTGATASGTLACKYKFSR